MPQRMSKMLMPRNFRAGLLGVLGVVGILGGGALQAADPVRLELVRGEEAAETLPQAVGFRFELRAYVMPLADGEFVFGFSPYAPPGEAAEAADFAVTVSLVDAGTDAVVESITATEADTKMTVRLQANRMYRLDLASLRNGLAADRSGKVVFPSGLAVALEATAERPAWVEGFIGAIFVPSGTTEIVCFGEPRLSLISPSKQRTDLGMAQVKEDGLARLPVDPGEDGRFWVVGNQTRGKVFFAGSVPGWINVNQADLLLPKSGE